MMDRNIKLGGFNLILHVREVFLKEMVIKLRLAGQIELIKKNGLGGAKSGLASTQSWGSMTFQEKFQESNPARG